MILNYAEFVGDELDPDSQAHKDVEEIRRAAERAAALTRQLLIFSRREVVKPEVLYLRDVVAELENLLRRALGERIELATQFGDERLRDRGGPRPDRAGAGQPGGQRPRRDARRRPAGDRGRTRPSSTRSTRTLHADIEPGPYVRLKVSDTGVGMDTETVEQVFEPFFTTKSGRHRAGAGDRLRDRHRGRRPDRRLLGARHRHDGQGPPSGELLGADRRGAGAQPSAAGRAGARWCWSSRTSPMCGGWPSASSAKAGYSVIAMSSGERGARDLPQNEQPIDLLLTDVIMPDMLGTELVEQVEAMRPGLPVVFMSGYSHEVLAPGGAGRARRQRLHREAVQRGRAAARRSRPARRCRRR